MISVRSADLPTCNSEIKGDCKVIHIVNSERNARKASYIGYIFRFQPWQTLKYNPCMTGSKKIVFGLG